MKEDMEGSSPSHRHYSHQGDCQKYKNSLGVSRFHNNGRITKVMKRPSSSSSSSDVVPPEPRRHSEVPVYTIDKHDFRKFVQKFTGHHLVTKDVASPPLRPQYQCRTRPPPPPPPPEPIYSFDELITLCPSPYRPTPIHPRAPSAHNFRPVQTSSMVFSPMPVRPRPETPFLSELSRFPYSNYPP